MTRFHAHRIVVDLPPGWEAQVRASGRDEGATPTDEPGPWQGSVLHAASFALPPRRGDYGSGAVEVMGGSDVLVCLLEHEPEAATAPLFRREGIPRLDPAQFSPHSMQRAIAGMSGSQQFFQVSGRPMCLYVVVGSHRTRGPLVRTANEVVRSLQITP